MSAIAPTRTWYGYLFGIGTALCFSSSSIFIRYGLVELPSPLIGVTIGMSVCAVAYGLLLLLRRGDTRGTWRIPRRVLALQILSGALVGLSTWARWVALDTIEIAVAIALGRLSIPVVLIFSPLLIGQRYERVTPRVWFGATVILAGSLILTFF